MTRDNQILKATAALEGTLLNQGHSNQYAEAFADGFYEGAAWADTNPLWHKCSDELPEPNVPVLVLANADTESFQFVGYYDDDDEFWRDDLNDEEILASIDYWTELPQPPKFD